MIVHKQESLAEWQNPTSVTNAIRSWDGLHNMGLMTNSQAETYVQGLGAGWYLPSIDELSLLWHNRFHANKALFVGGFTLLSNAANYWSSTESNAISAWLFTFYSGDAVASSKTIPLSVRAVRAF
ncbi:MAG: DUF1566 domain-containing protein [Saprospiraceae bacterium]|nr:DUF1566 domain-containing protein [Saprospiraceae bacterium]